MGDRKISQASDMLNWRSNSHVDTRIDIKEETYTSSQEDLKKMQGDSIMKRIPRGAEATTVLVSQENQGVRIKSFYEFRNKSRSELLISWNNQLLLLFVWPQVLTCLV